MTLHRLAGLPASRESVGLYFTLTAMGYELSLFFNWFTEGIVFPQPTIMKDFLDFLKIHIFPKDHELKFLILLIALTVICLHITMKGYKDLKDKKYLKKISDLKIEKLKNWYFRIGLFLFLLIFFIFWDSVY
jgi:hypothetical protein